MSRKSRFVRFVSTVAAVSIAAILVFGLLWFLNRQFGVFGTEIGKIKILVSQIDSKLSQNVMAGITFGSIVVTAALFVIPLFRKSVHKKTYMASLWRGIIAALAYIVASKFYEWAESKGNFTVIIATAGFVAVTFLVVEAVVLVLGDQDESGLRTELTASIASGAVLGIILKLGAALIQFLQNSVSP